MFIAGMEPHIVRKSTEDIRARALEHGRDPQTLKLIVGMLVIVDETDEKARAKYEEYLSYADLEGSLALAAGWTGTDFGTFSDDEDFHFTGPPAIQSVVSSWSAAVPGSDGVKWTKKRVATELALGGPHPKAIGSPQTVANIMQNWVDEAGIDGFNIPYAINPGDFEDLIKWLWTQLRKRGVFWEDYPATTTRENYLADGKGPRLREDHPGSAFKWH
ncbi:luciferase-like domain-containing protein [Phyllosticta citriasiana]